MAIDQIRLRERGLLEATLLLADMLSGGGPSVPAFTIAPDGLMTGGMAALSRAIPDVLPEDEFATMATRTPGPVNGIEILGQFWRFPVDMTGGIVDTRWNGAFP
jgi:hypothetical protein